MSDKSSLGEVLVVWGTGVASSKQWSKKFEISWFKKFRVLKKVIFPLKFTRKSYL